MNPTEAVKRELAPTGRLRVAINLSNGVLAQTDSGGKPKGVTVELAAALGERTGLPVDLVPFDAAGKTFAAATRGEVDIVFLAQEPERAKKIKFTAAYVLIEGYFVVPEASPVKTAADVDRKGVRIVVTRDAAYDLYLTRVVKNAELVRAATDEQAFDVFVGDHLEAAAGVKQPVMKFIEAHAGFRLVEPRFMSIEQAMGTPIERTQAAAFLHSFIEDMKASGFVANALARSGQHDAVVAPPALANSSLA